MSKRTLSKFCRPAALFGIATLSAVVVASTAFAGTGTPASIIAFNQKPTNSAVTITYAYLPKDGALDIFAVGPNGMRKGKSLGNVALRAGDHRDVSVTLNAVPAKGTRLVAVIEKDKPVNSSGDRPERTFSIL